MRTSLIALGAAGLAAVALAGMALSPLWSGRDAFADCRDGQVAGGDIGGPFSLVSARGEDVTDAQVLTEPSILYFGFTSCPDVCPLDMARNAQAVDLLAERGVKAQPVFVSVDPGRDTPEIVGDYAALFHPEAIGLTGSPEQVDAAARAYRVYHAKVGDDPENYLVDHSTYSYLVLPGTGFVDFVDRDEPAEAVADRLQCFVEAVEA